MSMYHRSKVLRLSQYLLLRRRVAVPLTLGPDGYDLMLVADIVRGLTERELLPNDATASVIWHDYSRGAVCIRLHSEHWKEATEGEELPLVGMDGEGGSYESMEPRWEKALKQIFDQFEGKF